MRLCLSRGKNHTPDAITKSTILLSERPKNFREGMSYSLTAVNLPKTYLKSIVRNVAFEC